MGIEWPLSCWNMIKQLIIVYVISSNNFVKVERDRGQWKDIDSMEYSGHGIVFLYLYDT